MTIELLTTLRENGWRVGVHNDYTINGEDWTFWLLTHPAGLYVRGEGRTDLAALEQCAAKAHKVFAPSP